MSVEVRPVPILISDGTAHAASLKDKMTQQRRVFSGSKIGKQVKSIEERLKIFMSLYGFFEKQGFDGEQSDKLANELQDYLVKHGWKEGQATTLVIEQPQTLRPMPTHSELEAAGNLYSQAYGAGRTKNIIQHLQAVWMPWIEAGVLTQPELNKPDRDPSAYKALAAWRLRPGNDLKTALGHNIPSKSDLINDELEAAAHLQPGDRPAKLEWVVRARTHRENSTKR